VASCCVVLSVLHPQKHAFLHVLCFDVCDRSAIFCSTTSLSFCDIGSTAASFAALLTEPTQHCWRLCSWKQPSRQNNTLLCCTTIFTYLANARAKAGTGENQSINNYISTGFHSILLFCKLFSCMPAGNLDQSERDILTLRSQQGRFDERIAMMQHLLEVSSTFPWNRCASNVTHNQPVPLSLL